MGPRIGYILLFIGAGFFIATLIVWFLAYPKKRRFLERLKKEFDLEYPKGVLMFRAGKLKGFYRDHEITIAPFATEGEFWILLRLLNPENFLGSIKVRKPGMFLAEPVFKDDRKELFTGNSAFDSQFKILGKPAPDISKILTPPIQKGLIELAEKTNFEIQILQDGIFYTSEGKAIDIDLIKFISDLLVDTAKNITFSQ